MRRYPWRSAECSKRRERGFYTLPAGKQLVSCPVCALIRTHILFSWANVKAYNSACEQALPRSLYLFHGLLALT